MEYINVKQGLLLLLKMQLVEAIGFQLIKLKKNVGSQEEATDSQEI